MVTIQFHILHRVDPKKIFICSVHPGIVDTDMLRGWSFVQNPFLDKILNYVIFFIIFYIARIPKKTINQVNIEYSNSYIFIRKFGLIFTYLEYFE